MSARGREQGSGQWAIPPVSNETFLGPKTETEHFTHPSMYTDASVKAPLHPSRENAYIIGGGRGHRKGRDWGPARQELEWMNEWMNNRDVI